MPQQPPSIKPLYWMGSTLKDLRDSPEDVKDGIGYALDLVQKGEKPSNAKPLKGFGGASVLEIVEDSDGDTWRAVVHGGDRGRDSCAQFIPEEGEEGHRDTEEGD
jgi:hypothetical protein